MAHEVINIPPTEEEILERMGKKPKVRFVEKIRTVIKTKLPPLTDAFTILTISFWYFFFTGIAVARGKKIPKEWMKIATNLSSGKVAKRIKEMAEVKDEPKRSWKVVDLQDRKTIYDDRDFPPTASN